MSKPIKIRVTAKDIKEGQRYRSGVSRSTILENCAVARALKRKFKTDRVSWFYRRGLVGKREFRALEAALVEVFVQKHDARKPVKPFSFTIVECSSLGE